MYLFILVEPFAATSLEPESNSDLFATSPPALEKDVKTQAKKVLSLFDEEEEERLEDDGTKNAQKEIGVVSLETFLNREIIFLPLHLSYYRQGFVFTLPSLQVTKFNLFQILNFQILGW